MYPSEHSIRTVSAILASTPSPVNDTCRRVAEAFEERADLLERQGRGFAAQEMRVLAEQMWGAVHQYP